LPCEFEVGTSDRKSTQLKIISISGNSSWLRCGTLQSTLDHKRDCFGPPVRCGPSCAQQDCPPRGKSSDECRCYFFVKLTSELRAASSSGLCVVGRITGAGCVSYRLGFMCANVFFLCVSGRYQQRTSDTFSGDVRQIFLDVCWKAN